MDNSASTARNVLATALSFVLSANYLHRGSDRKWLVRAANTDPKVLRADDAVSVVVGENIRFETSGQWESGFGCGLVAKADRYETPEKVALPEDAVKLRFNGSWFMLPGAGDSYTNRASGADKLFMLEDGSVYAVGVKHPEPY